MYKRQRDKLRKYAAYEDMIVAGEYSDEGFSGKNIQGRQDFQRMPNDIQDGKDDVSYVLVFKLSGKFLAGLMYAVVNAKHKCQLYEKQRTAGDD